MVVISVAYGIDICGFEFLILQEALKYGVNRCALTDRKGGRTR